MRKSIIFFLSFFCMSTILAQQEIRSFGNLQLHAGSEVTAFGNLTNTSTATLLNNGSLYVRGTLTNDQASMAAGTGTLFLNGSSAQSVAGSAFFRTYNLNTDNTAGITLNNDLRVTGTHTFTNGLIATSATPNYLVYEAGSSHAGSNDSRHVTGWVKKMGSENFVFPVGDNTYGRSAAISNLSASSEINCHYYTPTQNIFSLQSPIVHVKANEYWQINRISGGTAQITLNWDHSKVTMDNELISDITVAYNTGGNWTDAVGSAAGNVTTTGTVVSNSVNTFGSFTIGYKAYPVPVKLLSFTGERISGVTLLRWITENEQNTERFEVQRSYMATSGFITIGSTGGRNSGSRELYDFSDPSAFQGIAYYRLKTIDKDGGFSYSRIIAVMESDINNQRFIVLNPVRTAITVFNKTMQEGPFDYALYTAAGQLILKGTVNMGSNGSAVLPLPSQTPGGLYVLDISNRNVKFKQKIIVQ
ncbi:MAG TPA: T9SS type A sorting domain-containing protein [Chitinophagaceae bacterium]|nr:T9SS type A sorting domain-containing protein [Chitinophagaceae bacterium]